MEGKKILTANSGAIKVALIYFLIGITYILFSDRLILKLMDNDPTLMELSVFQSVKGSLFILITSLILFFLIRNEIRKKQTLLDTSEKDRKKLNEVLVREENLNSQLKDRNKFIETVLNQLPIGIAVNDIKTGKTKYINNRFEQIYGWPKDELPDVNTFFEKILPDKNQRENIRDKFLDDMESGQSDRRSWKDVKIVTRDGKVKIINAKNILMEDAEEMISTVLDVSDEYQTKKEKEFIFNHANDLICFAGYEGYLKTVNPAWTQLLGWAEAELLSNHIETLIHPDERKEAMDHYRKALHGNILSSVVHRFITKSGKTKYISWNVIPIEGGELILGIGRDVTAEKKMETELRESEKKYRNLVESSHDLIWEVDTEGNILFMNQASRWIYGYDPEELIGKHFLEFVPEEQYRKDEKVFVKALEAGKKVVAYESTFRHKDGHIVYLLANSTIIKDENNNPVGVRGISKDITQLKKQEQKLRASEKKFRSVFENSLTAITIADDNGNVLSVNKAGGQLFGYSISRLVNMNISEFSLVKPQDAGKNFRKFLKKRKDVGEFDYISPQGITKTIQYHAIRINKDFNLSVMIDITRQKEVEKDLRSKESFLRSLIATSPVAIHGIDINSNVILWNESCEKMFGWKEKEVLGKKLPIIPEDKLEEHRKLRERVLAGENIIKEEVIRLKKDGSQFFGSLSAVPQNDENGALTGILAVMEDITQRKVYESEIALYHNSLRELNLKMTVNEELQRKNIAANIHDELSQLLVISKMKLNEMLEKKKQRGDRENLSLIVEYITEALQNARKITSDLSPPVLYELGLIDALYSLKDKTEEQHRIKIHFEPEIQHIDLPDHKKIMLYRILQEILNNIIKHARARNVGLKIRQKDHMLEFRISDDGKGFDISKLKYNKYSGSGFGLFMVKERIKGLNGKFEIKSREKKGTEIIVEIPYE